MVQSVCHYAFYYSYQHLFVVIITFLTCRPLAPQPTYVVEMTKDTEYGLPQRSIKWTTKAPASNKRRPAQDMYTKGNSKIVLYILLYIYKVCMSYL